MGTIIIKAEPGLDLYVAWSSIVEAPTAWGTRAEMAEYLWKEFRRDHPDCTPGPINSPDARLDRVDRTGTSAAGGYTFGAWDDGEFIYEQRGLLPRSELARACELLADGREQDVWALLEPFEDDEPATAEEQS